MTTCTHNQQISIYPCQRRALRDHHSNRHPQQGLTWNLISEGVYPFWLSLLMMALDSAAYLLLGLYFDQV